MTPTIEAERPRQAVRQRTARSTGSTWWPSPGRCVAVLGPNGAGKTTFVRAVATLLRPDAGTLRVAGHDVRREPEAVRRTIGLAGQFAAVEPAMSGRENLEMVARLFGQDRRAARANAPRPCSTGSGWPRRRPARPHVLGRHAAQARPRREPGGCASAPAARRADDRARSAEPHRAVGRDPVAGRAGDRRPAHDPVPGRGRSPREPRRDRRPRPSGRRRARRTSSSAGSGGNVIEVHVRRPRRSRRRSASALPRARPRRAADRRGDAARIGVGVERRHRPAHERCSARSRPSGVELDDIALRPARSSTRCSSRSPGRRSRTSRRPAGDAA